MQNGGDCSLTPQVDANLIKMIVEGRGKSAFREGLSGWQGGQMCHRQSGAPSDEAAQEAALADRRKVETIALRVRIGPGFRNHLSSADGNDSGLVAVYFPSE